MGCIISVDKLKVTNKTVTVYSPKDSRATGMKVTVSFHPLSDKEHTLLATDCLLISLHLAFFWHRDKRRCLWQCHHKNKLFPLHLGSTSASTTIIYAEWPRAVITGSLSGSISVTSSLYVSLLSALSRTHTHTLLPSLLRLLGNDIWPREGTEQRENLSLSRTRHNNLIGEYSGENEPYLPACWSACFVLPDRQLLHQSSFLRDSSFSTGLLLFPSASV